MSAAQQRNLAMWMRGNELEDRRYRQEAMGNYAQFSTLQGSSACRTAAPRRRRSHYPRPWIPRNRPRNGQQARCSTPEGIAMTPEEALEKATELPALAEYSQIVTAGAAQRKDVSVAAATVVAPIILRMRDGRSRKRSCWDPRRGWHRIYLLAEVFEIAAEAGLIPGGGRNGGRGEVPPEVRQMAEQAVQLAGPDARTGRTGRDPDAASGRRAGCAGRAAGLMQEGMA